MTTSQPATEANDDQALDEWVILDLMGHRRLAGRLREVQFAGDGFLRLDIPGTSSTPAMTQYYRPGAVYCITPTSEEIARSIAGGWSPPVSRFELPTRPETSGGETDGEDEEWEPYVDGPGPF